MKIFFLLFLSVAPSVIILLYLYRKDKYEQEPLSILMKSFGLGALSAVGCIILGLIIPIEPNTEIHFVDSFITAFFSAAIPEECFKFLFLYLLIWNNENFSERFDGLIYAVFVSLGFATLENIIYVVPGGSNVAFARAITAVPAHALFGVAMGFYFSYAKFVPEYKNKYLATSIAVPIIMHGVYDFLIFSQEKFWESHPELSILLLIVFVVFVVFLWVQGFNKIKKLSADFYFQGIPQNEIQDYLTTQNNDVLSTKEEKVASANLCNWQEVTPQLLNSEMNTVLSKYPDTLFEDNDGILVASLFINRNTAWLLQLTYARNYRKLKKQLRVYIIEPDLNELATIANDIPYVKMDLSGSNYLDISFENEVSGVTTIDNTRKWISMFEKWINEEIEYNEFIIN